MAAITLPISQNQRLRELDFGSSMDLDPSTCAVIRKAEGLLNCRLRDWQARAVQSLLCKRDLFVKAGTGSGKSYVFLSMTMARENGIVLVISPLKSLMEDQVHKMTESFSDL